MTDHNFDFLFDSQQHHDSISRLATVQHNVFDCISKTTVYDDKLATRINSRGKCIYFDRVHFKSIRGVERNSREEKNTEQNGEFGHEPAIPKAAIKQCL